MPKAFRNLAKPVRKDQQMAIEPSPRHIVIGATCFADAKSAIELAAILAEAVNADLKAYLVEDEALYEYASLPFAKAISFGSNYQAVTPQAMLEAFGRDAVAFRRAIEETAHRKALGWTFETRRGEFDAIFNPENISGDFIVLGYQSLRKRGFEIVVLDEAGDLDITMIELASKLAKLLDVPLHVALFPQMAGEAILVSSDAHAPIRNLAEKLTIVRGEAGKAEFLKSVQKSSPSAIITSAGMAGRIGVNTLLEAGRCPVVISAS
jgi:hypothetical protein